VDDVIRLLTGLGPFGLGVASAASPCLLPLYPTFVGYLASNAGRFEGRRALGAIGFLILAGLLTTVVLVGVVLTAVSAPMAPLLSVLTPVVDGLLIGLGLLLIANRNPFARLPVMRVPVLANPYGQAFAYGAMLGPLALPCAGPFLVGLLGISLDYADAVGRIGTFVLFGLGFGLPLLLLSLLAGFRARATVGWVVRHHRAVEIVAGVVLIVVAVVDLVDKAPLLTWSLGSTLSR
jgi:cytochrome c-type biogenesis protein